ncbi:antA/AntB antirepressor family protein [Aneurinibacillus thermoaerophilus]|uniref:antA/AntB antirepressor family protein n=1 Tax=Aneurinibacillus thermoaerophilus TaxID=143495 RepID=UPI002E22F79A|nr:antA/AntB antirepressor family protein [Aneurinibacillus thermoaerophilus]MED0765508.1 antA/AntB antirepressor family protein [Aneurinibacillus thermoaerophilus]
MNSNLRVIADELIPVYADEQNNNLVNARELHLFLESKQKFTDWIANRIEKYGFIENEDFFVTLGKSNGGRPAIEYTLTIDTAKEIAMVENNERGRQARKYFIEMERRAKQMESNVVPLSKDQALVTVLRTTADLVEGQQELRQLIEKVDQKVEQQITLNSGEQRKVQIEIAKRVYELADQLDDQQLGFVATGEIVTDAGKARAKMFRSIHRDIKDRFAVSSYKDVRRCEMPELMRFINGWRPRLIQ